MDDLRQSALDLQAEIEASAERIDVDSLLKRKLELDSKVSQPDFWHDPQKAQEVVRQQSKLESRVKPWLDLQKQVNDLLELVEMSDDPTMRADLSSDLNDIIIRLANLKSALKFSGPYDHHDVILSIYAGAGGTDAQDWAQMLLRMYMRWAEANEYTVKTVDESPGDEAGIKSATLEISGEYTYGKLKGEHGVHRLVRLSPFNAESRETSFAKVEIMPKVERPDEVAIDEKDLRIDVYRSGGHGGQSVNTTDSAVRVTHVPTGVVVAIQNERSQLQNKETALTILRSKLLTLQLEQHKEKISELKGASTANEFGSQIRNYVLHPYKQVKDLRSKYETSDVDGVLNGDLNPLIEAYLNYSLGH